MFESPNVLVNCKKLTLGRDSHEGVKFRTAELRMIIAPLTIELATDSKRVPLKRHCFESDGLPLRELKNAYFDPPARKFRIEVREAPDADPLFIIPEAEIFQVRVWRILEAKRDLQLELVTRSRMDSTDRALGEVVRAWEIGALYLSFEELAHGFEWDHEDVGPAGAGVQREKKSGEGAPRLVKKSGEVH